MSYEICTFGSLRLDGMIVATSAELPIYDGSSISIGETSAGAEITWIRPEGMNIFVAKYPLLRAVSYEDLEREGFVKGRFVSIAGNKYVCRLLLARYKGSALLGEWTRCLDATSRGDEFWHWRDNASWCADGDVCGFTAARLVKNVDEKSRTTRNKAYCFRPVLVPCKGFLPNGREVVLDGQSFLMTHMDNSTDIRYSREIKLQPTLYPLTIDKDVDKTTFKDVARGAQVPMYTLLMDGKPVRQDRKTPAKYKAGSKLQFTDEFFGEEFLIYWEIQPYGATAVKPILRGITLKTLREQAYYNNIYDLI